MNGWRSSAHANNAATLPAALMNDDPPEFRTMGDAACSACHRPHSAVEPERLLRDRARDLCVTCHDGLTATDITGVINQRSGHRFNRLTNVHDPTENPMTMNPHVDCVDCHNPHAVRGNLLATALRQAGGNGSVVPPAMEQVPGVTLGGMQTDRARFYYEVCFRCHADNPVRVDGRVLRQRESNGNVRRDFLPTAASAHPVTFASRVNNEVPSLRAEYRNRPFISCQDCHNNPDATSRGGGGPDGPHGSRYEFLLADRYETADFTTESAQAYSLCYQCHDRNSILNDESFAFHRIHVTRGQSPCSACHTPHGVNGSRVNHSHLINFDVSIVGGERRFVDRGRQSGSCTLTCHGVRHVDFRYGDE
jgi:predicted CXXCH cytochrome family protein